MIYILDPLPLNLPNNYDQKEAKQKLTEGVKVTHWLFSDNEYIWIESGLLKDEKENVLNWDEFWMCRQAKNFLDGWTEYK